jgi:Fe-S oxidoreductase
MGLDADRSLLERTASNFRLLDSGCCGMAGAFGFEAEHYDISLAIGERVLLPAVREAAAETLILADGFSCRQQIAQTTGRRPVHLAELLAGHSRVR